MSLKTILATAALYLGLASPTYQATPPERPAPIRQVIEHKQHKQKPAKKQTWQEELYKIGLESTIDDIERGGIKLGNTTYELENEVRYDKEKFKEFLEGEDKHYSTLKGHLTVARDVRCTCNPGNTAIYTMSFIDLDRQLDQMLVFKEKRKVFDNPHSWGLFTQFLPHCIYMSNSEQRDNLKAKIAAYKIATSMMGKQGEEEGFHTHPGGGPPSLQDMKVSQNRKEYVVAVTKEGECTIYLAYKGKTEIVYTKKPDN